MKRFFSEAAEYIDINHIQSSLRSGKWLYDDNERQWLVEQVKGYEEPLMNYIMTGIGIKPGNAQENAFMIIESFRGSAPLKIWPS